jgi:magnesium chelatase subunit D
VVVTDGRATESGAVVRSTSAQGGGGRSEPVRLAARAARLLAAEGAVSVVVDCESGPVRLGLAGALSRDLAGTVVTLEELRADAVSALVRDARRAA